MEVLILGVYLQIFLFRIKWSKIRVRIIHGRALYTGKYGTKAGERETRQKSASLPPKAGELASLPKVYTNGS